MVRAIEGVEAIISEVKHMQVKEMQITPELAAQWLGKNTSNRRLNKNVVNFYARQIAENRWILNGETIKFNGESLVDGQHRLHAIVQAGRPIRSAVVFGLPDKAFRTVDAGRTRTYADDLFLTGFADSVILAATVRLIRDISLGYYYGQGKRANTPSRTELQEYLVDHPEIIESVNRTKKVYPVLTQSTAAALHFLFSQKDATLAEVFMEQLKTGENLAKGDPAFMLRERMVRDRLSKYRLKRKETLALCIKAWNAARVGKKVLTLRWTTTGDSPEAFPEIF